MANNSHHFDSTTPSRRMAQEGNSAKQPQDDPVFAEEEQRLAEVELMLKEALSLARSVSSSAEESYTDTKRYLAENRGELAPEEVLQSNLALQKVDLGAAAATASSARLEKQMSQPYFARVDFHSGDKVQTTYIGAFAFRHRSQSVVSDWRSPVASLFYDFETGNASLETPSGTVEGILERKRQIRIEDGRLEFAADSNSSVRDEVLQMELARESSSQMRTIVSSIQKEQNDLIRDESAGTLVIQGAAGSGKTSIALHRVAFLLYRRRGRLTADSVAIVSPNRVFGSYISNVLPELGEEPIRQLGMHDLASDVLGPRITVAKARSFVDGVDAAWRDRAQFKATREFADKLVEFVDESAQWIFRPHDLELGELKLSGEWLGTRFASYKGVPFDERLEIVADDALSYLRAETFERHGDRLPSPKRLQSELARMLAAKDEVALYKEFFKRSGMRNMLEWKQDAELEWEDAFPLALCSLAFRENEACRAIGHLVVDEMQDLTPVQHVALARLFECEKTLLGDVNQLVDDRAAFRAEDVAAAYGGKVATLSRSYRSTSEIMDFAACVNPSAKVDAIERHGSPVEVAACGNSAGVVTKLDEIIGSFEAGSHRTLGIVHKSEDVAKAYAGLLSRDHDVHLVTQDSTSFHEGVTVCSVRMAKGLEFDEVVVLDVDDSQYASEFDRNLLYVAVTRAMHGLHVLYRVSPSRFLP